MQIPDDVKTYIRTVFRACNAQTAGMLMSMPSTHEETLDTAFIAEAAKFSAPILFPSEWIVRIDTHFLGGRRHWYNCIRLLRAMSKDPAASPCSPTSVCSRARRSRRWSRT